jgi:hypothetical protein
MEPNIGSARLAAMRKSEFMHVGTQISDSV